MNQLNSATYSTASLLSLFSPLDISYRSRIILLTIMYCCIMSLDKLWTSVLRNWAPHPN